MLGADTMRGAIAALVPGVVFQHRERLSELTYVGAKKLSRMPPRSAIVGFSVENVYAIAELLRRQKGGAAVVMGALSPRTRNAQVDLYQNGEVDYLVATDAIGMGLNLDIRHVAFSALSKFDGRRMRPCNPTRWRRSPGAPGAHENGTFGVTGEARPLDDGMAEAITEHRFAPVRKLHWRNARLDFGSPERLIAVARGTYAPRLADPGARQRRSAALKTLADMPGCATGSGGRTCGCCGTCAACPISAASAMPSTRACWNRSSRYLHDTGAFPTTGWRGRSSAIDRTEGDIDTLSQAAGLYPHLDLCRAAPWLAG